MLLCSLWSLPAHAWIEVTVSGDNVVLDVDASGMGLVRHEVLLRIRGGPFKSITIEGVDADAVASTDATLTRAVSGQAAGPAIPMTALVQDGDLQLGVPRGSRVGSGQYLLNFSYGTNLGARGLLQPGPELATLRWVGPRFDDGIDSVRVLFRFPHGSQPPRVPQADPAAGQLGIVAEYDGVFLSDFRRAQDKDELEVVRPHVAKGEPVVWRVQVDAAAVGMVQSPANVAQPAAPALVNPAVARSPRQRTADLGFVVLAGLSFSLLVLQKARWFARAAALFGANARPLVPWQGWLRALLAGLALSLASALLLFSAYPLLSALPVVVAMMLAVELAPTPPSVRRGPGNWRNLGGGEAFAAQPTLKVPGALFDGGRLLGFVMFLCCAVALAVSAATLFNAAAARGAGLVIQALVLVPVFFTGRTSQLPLPVVSRSCRVLQPLLRRLRREAGLQVSVLGRFPASGGEPDELRLLIKPKLALLGLNAIEVACEVQSGFAGPMVTPVVLVRANDGSPSYEAMPSSVVWARGRTVNERACVLRPRIPTVGNTMLLLRQLTTLLSPGGATARRSGRRASVRGGDAPRTNAATA
jgi:hypothetical protein